MGGRRSHSRLAHLIGRRAFWAVAIGLLFGIPLMSGLLRRAPPAVPILGRLPAFTLEGADGAAIDAKSVAGRVWALAFMEPACPACVERVAWALSRIQERTRSLGPAFVSLSVSLDLQTTPAWLRAESELRRANPRVWWLAHGSDAPRLESAAAILLPAGPASGLSNGTTILLVDSRGRLRGAYATDGRGIDRALADVTLILNGDQ